tara:strand:+ start:1206 stop:3182 length:1977 start_codon:yes stop_codon:yes gene_type:complete
MRHIIIFTIQSNKNLILLKKAYKRKNKMLEALRQMTKSWIMKVILGLLALTFVVFFGASDFGSGGFSGRQANTVVEVEKVSYSLNQVSKEFNKQIQYLTRASGGQINLQSPIATTILKETVSNIVTRSLFDAAAMELGVSASDVSIQETVHNLKLFQNEDGIFDAVKFSSYLQQRGLSEEEFIFGAKEDLKRAQYLGTLQDSLTISKPVLDAIFNHRFEKRIAEITAINIKDVKGNFNPSENQLRAFYNEFKNDFRSPEYRKIKIAILTIEELSKTISVNEEEISKNYQDRIDDFIIKEKREIIQSIFLTESDAKNARTLINKGKTFYEASKQITGLPPVSIGKVNKDNISEKTLAETAFSLDLDTVSSPIETPLGWNLILVKSIEPEKTQTLAHVREPLRRAISMMKARDEIYNIQNFVEDDLAAGLSIEEVSKENGMTLLELEHFDSRGLKRDEQLIKINPIGQIVEAAFTTNKDELSDIREIADGGFFVIKTISIDPSKIEPFNLITHKVSDSWLKREKQIAAFKKAKEISNIVSNGKTLKEVSIKHGLKYEAKNVFYRTGSETPVPGPFIAAIFKAKVGDTVYVETYDGARVGKLTGIEKAGKTSEDKQKREDLNIALLDSMNRDLTNQLAAALKKRYTIDVNHELIESSLIPQ